MVNHPRLSHDEIVKLSRNAVAKVEALGARGAAKCTLHEIQAMAFAISAANTLPSPTALNEISFVVRPQTVVSQGPPIAGKFLAREGTVRFKPFPVQRANGTTSISMGFPLLSLNACVQDRNRVAFQLAALLNQNQSKEITS